MYNPPAHVAYYYWQAIRSAQQPNKRVWSKHTFSVTDLFLRNKFIAWDFPFYLYRPPTLDWRRFYCSLVSDIAESCLIKLAGCS